jgi:type IV pilus assembly protein PilV
MSSRQNGVTIVEGLVALVILSVGMLGIASLYVASLKSGRTALIRTEAVNLVNDMIDRIRANGAGRAAYDTDDYSAPTNPCNAGGENACSNAELASADLKSWLAAVDATLPATGRSATVQFTDGAGVVPDRYRVQVAWREAGEDQDLTYGTSVEIMEVRP